MDFDVTPLDGGLGVDVMTGGAGGDTLTGGSGSSAATTEVGATDTVVGTAGADRFTWRPDSNGVAEITLDDGAGTDNDGDAAADRRSEGDGRGSLNRQGAVP